MIALAGLVQGFQLSSEWTNALLALLVAGVTVIVGLLINQRSTVIRLDHWAFGDGRNETGAATLIRETAKKVDRTEAKVDQLSNDTARQTKTLEGLEVSFEHLEERMKTREAQWDAFLVRQGVRRRRDE